MDDFTAKAAALAIRALLVDAGHCPRKLNKCLREAGTPATAAHAMGQLFSDAFARCPSCRGTGTWHGQHGGTGPCFKCKSRGFIKKPPALEPVLAPSPAGEEETVEVTTPTSCQEVGRWVGMER